MEPAPSAQSITATNATPHPAFAIPAPQVILWLEDCAPSATSPTVSPAPVSTIAAHAAT
jgi:hypothetical protein